MQLQGCDGEKFYVLDLQSQLTSIAYEGWSHIKVRLYTPHIIFEYREYRQDPRDPVVQTIDLATHRINHYPADKYQRNQLRGIHWTEIHKINSVIQLSNNWVQIPLTCNQAFSFFLFFFNIAQAERVSVQKGKKDT